MPPWLVPLLISGASTGVGLLLGNKKDKEIDALIKSLKADASRAEQARLSSVNSAFDRAMLQSQKQIGQAGLGSTGIAQDAIRGAASGRGAALSQAQAENENQRRKTKAMIAQMLGMKSDPSAVFGQLAGVGLSGAMQGMFNNNDGVNWQKIFQEYSNAGGLGDWKSLTVDY